MLLYPHLVPHHRRDCAAIDCLNQRVASSGLRIKLIIEDDTLAMAQQTSPADDSGVWNPALRPEKQTGPIVAISTEDSGSDRLGADGSHEPKASNLRPSLSDDDFSAWDMPQEDVTGQSQNTELDSSMVNVHSALDTTGADALNSDNRTGMDCSKIAMSKVVLEDLPNPIRKDMPSVQRHSDQSVVYPGPVEVSLPEASPAETPSTEAAFPPGEEHAPFSELLSTNTESAQPQLNQPQAPSTETHSVEAVFASSDETDDFAALLTNNSQPTASNPEDPGTSTPAGVSLAAGDTHVDAIFPSGATSVDFSDLLTDTETAQPILESSNEVAGNSENKVSAITTTVQPADSDQPGFAESTMGATASGNAYWANEVDGDIDSDGDDFFNQLNTQTKPIFAPPEADSRYEEGVPLLDDSPPGSPERTIDQTLAADDIFANDNDDAEGFFSSAQNSDASKVPSLHVTRKSTSQVMESVGFDLDSPASDVSAAAQLDDAIRAASSPQVHQDKTEMPEPSEEELAARWEAELSDAGEDDLAARWEAALDDDDLLLGDDTAQPTVSETQPVAQSPIPPAKNVGPAGLNSPFETPQQTRPRPIPGVYAPHQPSTADLVGGVAIPGAAPPAASYFSQETSNPVTSSGESFAERPKEGYKSPYDLPDDLSRPRRPLATQKPPPPKAESTMRLPPPRDNGLVQHPLPSVVPPPQAAAAAAPPPAPKNFFEELPLPPPKSRPASSGRYSPNPSPAGATGSSFAPPPKNPYAPAAISMVSPPAPAPPTDVPLQSGLQPPERLDPYGATLASSAPAGPSAASRYSPKPPVLQGSTKPPSTSRYSPAPPAASTRNRYVSQPLTVPGHTNNLPFQPRTSSPLAYHEKVSYQPEDVKQQPQPPSLQPSVDLSPPRAQRPSVDQGLPYAPQLPNGSASSPIMQQQTPPKSRYAPPEYINDFAQRIVPNDNYAPVAQAPAVVTSPDMTDHQVVSPRRSQTQSPGQQMMSPHAFAPPIETLPRPASVHGSGSPTKPSNPYAPTQASVHNLSVSQQLHFIAPSDGQEHDPLERWKGAPIFKFGFGGAVVSCFPKHVPRYSVGQTAPMIMPSPGQPKFSPVNELLPAIETIVPHPGPLKAKSKKKDLLAWLSSKIAAFENEVDPNLNLSHPDAQKRHEEKILLWKITKILVENDGVLEGSPAIEQSLRQVFFPNLSNPTFNSLYDNTFSTPAVSKPFEIPSQPDSVDPQFSEELRTNLIQGDREKAVWGAVDRRLWGHAMVIASTMDKATWKQVVQEFVRREIRSATGNTESLAALYEIFAGNAEESIDELVPPSARAGHHLINKAGEQGAPKNALDGLNSWRDTLGLVLSNRSSEDQKGLLALGRLLASYGRTEAAHICFIFSRAAAFGGADDPHANIVLLGIDHQVSSSALMDEDAILLTETYEFATSVLGNSAAAALPYLLAFKVLHAKQLADRGRKLEAQNYCDGVASALKATTRPSPYHHQKLFAEVDELSARLRQTTGDGTSSWISKPSMEKVSGSMWARFNSFVAGDDSDAASTGSGRAGETADFGPFANVAGTPTVSRSPSVSDLYGSYTGVGAQPIPTGGPSRYLPSNQYAPNASPEQFRGRSSMDSQRSISGGVPFGQRRSSQEQPSPVDSHMFPGEPMYGSPGITGYQATPPQSSYIPLAPVEEDSTQSPAEVAQPVQPAVNGLFYQPPGQDPASVSQSPYYQGPPGMPQSDSYGHMPPTSSNAYEPPSYAPAMNLSPQPTEQFSVEENQQPRKKQFMEEEDDDDLAARAAAIQKAQKAENDRKADEAFRKAAEEDANRAAQQPKKGWFGGWFGGGKKESDNVGGGPIKAKLGEENSFYYDKELKKWVNKKDPNSAAPVRATPPPPRGSAPPSRAASSGSMPPPAPPMSATSGSRPPSSSSDAPPPLSSSPAVSTLSVPPPLGSMPRSVSTGATMSTPPGSSGGPSRPPSSLAHASSIDDLLGAPQARKGNTVRGKKKGRYVDVMAK
ncbi:uncharacterized protein N7459_009614 [Penicillium hispanicum]|uniref:uncharacterized protein n=1 Tax=Penicillium hispanicum TaxID=1080232 RepID=UPI00254256A0|nr:uncharacterized protein N7459_009614 [Penicillium hispanicum]KAJ5570184.1 hypothetical protein N7459_009614 [Penicillium hispanicum]